MPHKLSQHGEPQLNHTLLLTLLNANNSHVGLTQVGELAVLHILLLFIRGHHLAWAL
jgi:hypothetical protein